MFKSHITVQSWLAKAALKSGAILTALLLLQDGAAAQSGLKNQINRLQRDSVYHWRIQTNVANEFETKLEKDYTGLSQVDYTPPFNIQAWSSYPALQKLATSTNGNFTGNYVLLIDSKGIIREVRTYNCTDKKISESIISVLKNSKTTGPSYIRNKAVPTFIPCTLTITKDQISAI